MHPCIGLLFSLILEPLFRTRIGLLLAQTINRTAAGQSDHPAKWFTFLGGEIFRLVPYLHENLLQEIIGLGFVMNHPQDECLENAIVSIVKLRESIGIAGLNALH